MFMGNPSQIVGAQFSPHLNHVHQTNKNLMQIHTHVGVSRVAPHLETHLGVAQKLEKT